MRPEEITAGDTFPISYKHKQDGVLTDLPEGYDLLFGLRQEGNSKVIIYSYRNGEIENPDKGVYVKRIDHELSKSLSGTIVIEMVIYSRDGSVVLHCGKPVKVEVHQSFMNDYLDIE